MHALIIEQDSWIALMIEDALVEFGYTSFDFTASGDEALALAKERCPDLITSDIWLGSSEDIAAVRTICRDRDIPVVFVTSTGWEVLRRDADAAVVQKPFGPADLKRAIAEAHFGSAEARQ